MSFIKASDFHVERGTRGALDVTSPRCCEHPQRIAARNLSFFTSLVEGASLLRVSVGFQVVASLVDKGRSAGASHGARCIPALRLAAKTNLGL